MTRRLTISPNLLWPVSDRVIASPGSGEHGQKTGSNGSEYASLSKLHPDEHSV